MTVIHRIIRTALLFILLVSPTAQSSQSSPDSLNNQFNSALSLLKQENYDAALTGFQQIVAEHTTCAQAYFNMGLISIHQQNIERSINAFEQTVVHDPDNNRAFLYLGMLYQEQGDHEKALHCWKQMLRIDPEQKGLYTRIAQTFEKLGNRTASLEHYRKALAKDPANDELRLDVGNMLCTSGNYDEALKEYRTVLKNNPSSWRVMMNIAHTLRHQGSMKEAVPLYQHLLTLKPDDPFLHQGLAEAYLTLGNFTQGFQEFTWHWKRGADIRNFSQHYWDGTSPVRGKTILLRAEYGQGDTIQFIRYAQLLKKEGAHIIAEVQPTLIPLLSLCPYLDSVIAANDGPTDLPPFDIQIPLMNLPAALHITEQTIPTEPYIFPSPSLLDFWQKKIPHNTHYKIGICWQACPYFESFKPTTLHKSVPLEQFIPLMRLPTVEVYSLQQFDGIDQIAQLPADITLHTYEHVDTMHGRFMDTAAIIKQLDLVITVDTSIAHLAGALGKPVWVVLPRVADWRWMQHRIDSPWYPTMRLFRQCEQNNWTSLFTQVRSELEKQVASKQIHAPIQEQAVRSHRADSLTIHAEVAVGELIDKITILQIKNDRIKDQNKLINIRAELATLNETLSNNVAQSTQLAQLAKELRMANEKLWDIEDAIREKERAQNFDQEFIDLARSVYLVNDRRCEIKKEINLFLGSRLIEEKSYTDYRRK